MPVGEFRGRARPISDRGKWSKLLFVLPNRWGRQVRVRQAVRVRFFVGLEAPSGQHDLVTGRGVSLILRRSDPFSWAQGAAQRHAGSLTIRWSTKRGLRP